MTLSGIGSFGPIFPSGSWASMIFTLIPRTPSLVDVVVLWLACRDEVSVAELHGLGTLRAQLAADHHLTTLGTILHNETNDSIASTSDCQATKQLEPQRFSLRHGTTRTILHALCEELHTVFGEIEALLDNGSQLTDPAALLPKHLPRPSRLDDNLCPDGSDTDLDSRVAILGEGAHQKLVQLRIEDTICHELAFLGHGVLSCHCGRKIKWDFYSDCSQGPRMNLEP